MDFGLVAVGDGVHLRAALRVFYFGSGRGKAVDFLFVLQGDKKPALKCDPTKAAAESGCRCAHPQTSRCLLRDAY